jgi:hypothetical protein
MVPANLFRLCGKADHSRHDYDNDTWYFAHYFPLSLRDKFFSTC